MNNGVRTFIEGKKGVSLPELQEAFGLSYRQAREVLCALQEKGWTAKTPRGLYYRLNPRIAFLGRIDRVDAIRLARKLLDGEGEALNRLRRYGDTPTEEQILREKTLVPKRRKALEALGLLYYFEGTWHIPVSWDDIRRISDARKRMASEFAPLEAMGDPMLVKELLHELLWKALDSGRYPASLLALPIFGEDSLEYMVAGYERFKRNGLLPAYCTPVRGKPSRELLFELLGNLALTEERDDIGYYKRRAAECLAAAEADPASTGRLLQYLRMMVREIGKTIGMEDIRKMRENAAAHCGGDEREDLFDLDGWGEDEDEDEDESEDE